MQRFVWNMLNKFKHLISTQHKRAYPLIAMVRSFICQLEDDLEFIVDDPKFTLRYASYLKPSATADSA